MREHYGTGYRLFYKKIGNQIILLLAGAIKQDQDKVIKKAKECLVDYERRTR